VQKPPMALVVRLCEMLEDAKVPYCHWKSNNALERSASGENDLDLLVSRGAAVRCVEVLSRMGFKEAEGGAGRRVSGVRDFYGCEPRAERLVHAHVHYQLVVGHDMTKNVRIPIEEPFVGSAMQGLLFKVPAPHYEYVVFVIRMALKHLGWDAVVSNDRKLKDAEQRELEYLQGRCDMAEVEQILKRHLPYIDSALFKECVAALRAESSAYACMKSGRAVQRALEANARHRFVSDVFRKVVRRWGLRFRRRIMKSPVRRKFSAGGAMIAIVGGDGAGKTTLVTRLYSWLSGDLCTIMIHMGKPPESITTKLVRAGLRVGTIFGVYPHLNAMTPYRQEGKGSSFRGRYPWMLREACKARDRYATYLKGRRYVNRGGIVISDRFPVPQVSLMEAPVIGRIAKGGANNRLTRYLMNYERRCYERITPPELLIVLRLDPEVAVRRKTGEDPIQVRARSNEVWEADWMGSGVHVVDGGMSKDEVLFSIKSLIWSRL